MPSGGVLVAVALAGLLYFGGVEVVQGAKWVGHKVKVGVSRLVHPHGAAAPDPNSRPADNAGKSFP